jgi:hypothetical protein
MTKTSKKQSRRGTRRRGLAVISRMRNRGDSLSRATRALHTTPRTVRKHFGTQLLRLPSGRYSATSRDTLRRDLNVLSYDGYVPVTVRSSKQSQLASQHLIGVGRFLRNGDMQWLKPFIGRRVGGVELLTNPDRLQILADADLVKLDALYRNSPGEGRKK